MRRRVTLHGIESLTGPTVKRLHLTFPVIPFLLAAPACAAEPVPGMTEGLLQMLLGLAVVVGLLLGSLWLIKRLSTPGGGAHGMKILGGLPVGPRERIVLVEIGDKVLVLGITAAGINTLHTLERTQLPDEALAPAGAPHADFRQWLKQSLERRRDAH